MKTLKDYIVDQKCRKGPAAGTTKNGTYWLACDPIKIQDAGGDGIGCNAPSVAYYLRLRHFRDGAVRPQIHRKAWHQNGSYSGAGNQYYGCDQIITCTTVEDVIVALKSINIDESDCYAEHVYHDIFADDLTAALTGIGMPVSMPPPDEPDEQL